MFINNKINAVPLKKTIIYMFTSLVSEVQLILFFLKLDVVN